MLHLAICMRVFLILSVLESLGVLAQLKETGEYGNTWATYYEQPCCATKRHVRHHKGMF